MPDQHGEGYKTPVRWQDDVDRHLSDFHVMQLISMRNADDADKDNVREANSQIKMLAI